MSLIEVVEHTENIYTILKAPPPDPPKSPRYHSQLEKSLKAKRRPQLRRDFGYAEVPLAPPDRFLRKGEGTQPPRKETDHKCITSGKLPAVPRRLPPGPAPEKPKVNFKVLNIKKLLKVKGSVKPRLVDTRDGHIKTIKGSGEVPEYCLRPSFGRVPTYLVKRNRRIRKAMERACRDEVQRENLCQKVAEEERQQLLSDLKENWALLQKAFLQLPMLTDTVPKILKKTKMENQLRQLERDIAFIESNPHIYVFDDGAM